MNNEFNIFPPYRIFYVESLYTITYSAVNYINTFTIIHNQLLDGNRENEERILDCLQNIINQAAALSRYFWPVREKELHTNRGNYLKSIFEIVDENPLQEKQVRNAIEHFDERLDKFTSIPVVGIICPRYIGDRPTETGVPTHIFRAYYTDEKSFEVLGEVFYVMPIISEIVRIHNKVLEMRN